MTTFQQTDTAFAVLSASQFIAHVLLGIMSLTFELLTSKIYVLYSKSLGHCT